MSPKGDLAAALNVDGSNMKQAWFYHPTGSVTILHIEGKTVTPIKTIPVGAFPEAMAFHRMAGTSSSATTRTRTFSILKVDGTNVVDTGQVFKVPGHPASMRMGP